MRGQMIPMAGLPLVETTTGCVCLSSASGRLIIMVSTEPSVVPIHSVGSSVVGSTSYELS